MALEFCDSWQNSNILGFALFQIVCLKYDSVININLIQICLIPHKMQGHSEDRYINLVNIDIWGFTGVSGKEPACQCRRPKRCRVDPWVGKSPGEGMVTHSSILAWRVLWTRKPGGLESSCNTESDMTEVT